MSATAQYAAFGDSVTFGYGGSPGGWVLKLEQKAGLEIANLGIPGETSADGVKRIDKSLLLVPLAKKIILLHGGNDWVGAFRSSPCEQHCDPALVEDKYLAVGENLRAMRRHVRDSDREVIFATYWPSSSKACAMYDDKQFAQYQAHMMRLNDEIIKVAKENDDPLVRLDDLTAISVVAENFFDCLHPDDAGYRLIADRWMQNSDVF